MSFSPKSRCKNKPKFSIVIPTYNTEIVLSQCLSALCGQSQNKEYFEVIVVNDGGDDKTQKIVKRYENSIPIRYIFQKNKGPAAARNLGIRQAEGEIILFLDDDSLPTKNWFEYTVNAWEEYSDYDGIGGFTVCEDDESICCRVNSDFFNWYLNQYVGDQQHPFLVTCNAGYKKSILKKVNYFDESFKKASGEDRDLNVKIAKVGGKLILDKRILVYHDKDLTFKSSVKKHYNYGKAACSIYRRYPDLPRLKRSSYFDLYRSIIKKYPDLNEKIKAIFLITLSQVCTFVGYQASRHSLK